MANTDTANAKQYATLAQVAAAQAKIYADQSQDASGFAASAQESAEQSATAASSASEAANSASIAASTASVSATEAANSATSAESSAISAAEFGDNKNTFQSTSAGLAATTNGQYFRVSQGAGSVIAFKYYQNQSGVAVEVADVPGQGSVTNNIREYSTLSAAQSDVAAGNILNGAKCRVLSASDLNISEEYVNNSGTLVATGVKTPSQKAIDNLNNTIYKNNESYVLVITDNDNNVRAEIDSGGFIETDGVTLKNGEISSGDLSVYVDGNVSGVLCIDEDGNVLFDSSDIKTSGGGSDPGEVTVNLPPQTAAYNVLSKLRAAQDDVCIIINSDSTGIDHDTDPSTGVLFYKWTRKLANFLASNYPAYTVNYYTWSGTAYSAATQIQVGTSGKTLYFYNAAVAGTQPLYLMGNYFQTAYVPRQADLIILNHGHNTDSNALVSTQMGMDLAVMFAMLEWHPAAGGMIVSQNPLRDTEDGTKRSDGARQAATAAGFSLIDAFQLFQNAGKPSGWYMDNIHPNDVGDSQIFEIVKDLFVWPAAPAFKLQGFVNSGNLLKNGDFSTWTDTSQPPDNWSVTGCTASKDTTNFETGSWGMLLTQTGTIETYASQTLSSDLVKRLKGKTVALSCRVFIPTTSTRSNCGQVQIPEVTNTRTYGSSSGGRGGFVWKTTLVTIPATATSISVRAVLDTAGGVAGNWCTFDRMILTAGFIPQDSY
ncbi:SGNH/GDSL hydrolase family protein [Klebsiella variicola]|nr:SGNH/GDSL hydrolase family protein [Klebsiella variicola]QOV59931.1 SGNH/GDSL hydrolase family protein [Klebsiella variicola]